MPKLKRIEIKGFRSIKEMMLDIGPLNVLIGANGAGKSNLISFFKLVNELMGERLQQHIGCDGSGHGQSVLCPKVTLSWKRKWSFKWRTEQTPTG